MASIVHVQAEGQWPRWIGIHAKLPQTLPELDRGQPIGAQQAQHHEQIDEEVAYERDHLQA